MNRILALVACCSIALPSVAASVVAPDGAAQPVCDAPVPPGDRRVISCALPASGKQQRFRFRVTFLGGHDDTKASIAFAIDGMARDCDPGSKTTLFGEDGEVSLFCDFTSEAGPATKRATMTVVWSHADYKDFTLDDATNVGAASR